MVIGFANFLVLESVRYDFPNRVLLFVSEPIVVANRLTILGPLGGEKVHNTVKF